MQITRLIETHGDWLFRWRSYLPFLLLPLLAFTVSGYSRTLLGDKSLHAWGLLSLGVSIFGLAVRCLSVGQVPVGTSGRNTRSQVAEQLNTLGIYSTVRHPLYFGNFLIGLGIFLAPASLSLSIIYSLAFWLYYERIMAAEEAFLANKFGETFNAWVANTPAFLPALSLWKPADLPFSIRTVLRREYTGFLVVAAFHTGVSMFKKSSELASYALRIFGESFFV